MKMELFCEAAEDSDARIKQMKLRFFFAGCLTNECQYLFGKLRYKSGKQVYVAIWAILVGIVGTFYWSVAFCHQASKSASILIGKQSGILQPALPVRRLHPHASRPRQAALFHASVAVTHSLSMQLWRRRFLFVTFSTALVSLVLRFDTRRIAVLMAMRPVG